MSLLYANILHSDDIQAFYQALLQREESNPQQPPAEVITELLGSDSKELHI